MVTKNILRFKMNYFEIKYEKNNQFCVYIKNL